jgi:CHAD domain-containing protein
MQEREVKLVFRPGTDLPDPKNLSDGLGGWSVTELEPLEQLANYFDTRDLALTRAGASLRYRSDDGWTVKLPRAHDGASFVRDEYGIAGESGDPPRAAIDLVSALTRSRPLVEVARLRTTRRKTLLRDQQGRPMVEIDDDDVVATNVVPTNGGAAATRFREVEIESVGDADRDLVEKLVERLRKAGAEAGESMPKVARALGERAAAPPDLVVPEPLRQRATLGELVRHSVAAGVQRLIDHDPIVRTGDDSEGVHQARVATRRLRSDLRTFRPILHTEWSEPLRAELRWLGEQLGRVRDADVLLGRLDAKREGLPVEEQADADLLINRLRAMRERDRALMLDAMRSERYVSLLDRLVAAASAPRLRAGVESERASKKVAQLAHRPCKRLRKQVGRLPTVPSDSDLHELRKRAKQARYALEAITPVAGRRAARTAERIADLQSVLGDHQDAVVAVAWLRDAARDSDAEELETAFVAGRLSGSFDADRICLRSVWPRVWRRAERLLDRHKAS